MEIMEDNTKKSRFRKVSTWMSDAVESINHEEEIIAVKRIVLKVLRYMETNHMTQKELASTLGVSPQYINKFLHGQEDIKVSTAIRYGKILNLKLIEITDERIQKAVAPIVIYRDIQTVNPYPTVKCTYNSVSNPFGKKQYAYN